VEDRNRPRKGVGLETSTGAMKKMVRDARVGGYALCTLLWQVVTVYHV
jgi:hypothetical protein